MNNARIYGIFFDCPYKNRSGDCVVNQVIHLSYKERLDWFNKIYLSCSKRKEK
jgi:hypothetical protein